jgi:hypothetical protein
MKASSTSTRGAMKRLAGMSSTWPGVQVKKHEVQQRAVVGLVDLAADLHGARGQADLVADHLPPRPATGCATQARLMR